MQHSLPVFVLCGIMAMLLLQGCGSKKSIQVEKQSNRLVPNGLKYFTDKYVKLQCITAVQSFFKASAVQGTLHISSICGQLNNFPLNEEENIAQQEECLARGSVKAALVEAHSGPWERSCINMAGNLTLGTIGHAHNVRAAVAKWMYSKNESLREDVEYNVNERICNVLEEKETVTGRSAKRSVFSELQKEEIKRKPVAWERVWTRMGIFTPEVFATPAPEHLQNGTIVEVEEVKPKLECPPKKPHEGVAAHEVAAAHEGAIVLPHGGAVLHGAQLRQAVHVAVKAEKKLLKAEEVATAAKAANLHFATYPTGTERLYSKQLVDGDALVDGATKPESQGSFTLLMAGFGVVALVTTAAVLGFRRAASRPTQTTEDEEIGIE